MFTCYLVTLFTLFITFCSFASASKHDSILLQPQKHVLELVRRNATSPQYSNSTDEDAKSKIQKALSAMAVLNKARLENCQFNQYEVQDSSATQQKKTLAPPLAYGGLSETNSTLLRRQSGTNTTGTSIGSYIYYIPSELAIAAKILAEADAPSLPGPHASIASDIRAKYSLNVNDTNVSNQALQRSPGLIAAVPDRAQKVETIEPQKAELRKRETSSDYWMMTININQRGSSPLAPAGYRVSGFLSNSGDISLTFSARFGEMSTSTEPRVGSFAPLIAELSNIT
jgi:hypothetical protein